MKIKRTAFNIPTDNNPEIIKIAGSGVHGNSGDVMEDAGYTWINALDIDNHNEVFDKSSGLACNHLYLKDGVFYVWRCWESESGFMDTATGNLLIYKFGELES